jgi:hypothetical protein
VSEDDFAIVFEAGGAELRVQKLPHVDPPSQTVLGWQVTSIRRTVDGLAQRGIAFERYPHIEQDDRGIWQAPSGARIAWFKDPDGNTLSLTEPPAVS